MFTIDSLTTISGRPLEKEEVEMVKKTAVLLKEFALKSDIKIVILDYEKIKRVKR